MLFNVPSDTSAAPLRSIMDNEADRDCHTIASALVGQSEAACRFISGEDCAPTICIRRKSLSGEVLSRSQFLAATMVR